MHQAFICTTANSVWYIGTIKLQDFAVQLHAANLLHVPAGVLAAAYHEVPSVRG